MRECRAERRSRRGIDAYVCRDSPAQNVEVERLFEHGVPDEIIVGGQVEITR